MIKRKQNKKPINDQEETKFRQSMIKGKQNTNTISDQKETEHNDYQRSKGNRAQRLSMIKRKQSKKTINYQHGTTEETKAWVT